MASWISPKRIHQRVLTTTSVDADFLDELLYNRLSQQRRWPLPVRVPSRLHLPCWLSNDASPRSVRLRDRILHPRLSRRLPSQVPILRINPKVRKSMAPHFPALTTLRRKSSRAPYCDSRTRPPHQTAASLNPPQSTSRQLLWKRIHA